MNPAAEGGCSLLPDVYGRQFEETLRRTAIVILTWNQLNKTRRCLCSLARAGYSLDRIVLWDNGSEDGTEESITREFPDVIYHRHPRNLGVASGRNAAARYAIHRLSASHLLFLDNDMVAPPGLLEYLSRPFLSELQLAQTVAKIRVLDDPGRLQSAGGFRFSFALGTKSTYGYGEIDDGQYNSQKPCLPSGGATLVLSSVFLKLGGFDPIFDPYGPEDFDFSHRVRTAGYRAQYVPEAVVYHDYRFDLDVKSVDATYFSRRIRHWLILLHRHASLPEKIIFFLLGAPLGIVRVAWRELLRANLAALKGIPRGFRSYSRFLNIDRQEPKVTGSVGAETD